MEPGLTTRHCSYKGSSLSLSSSPSILIWKFYFSSLPCRSRSQAYATRARTSKLSSLEGKQKAIQSSDEPVEDEKEDVEDDKVDQFSSNLISSLFDYGSLESGPSHRSGYVAVLGKPNVGKSTLLNQIIGQKLSIVTAKPQTTRHRILGLCSTTDYQIILYDTPGVVEKKMHKLDSFMMKNVRTAAINADCMLLVTDASTAPKKIDEIFHDGLDAIKNKVPILLVLNKKDLIKPIEIAKRLEWYEKFFVFADEVLPVSAKFGHGVEDVKEWIISKLPLGPVYYPKDIVSEHSERFFVAEIVREKIFMQYRKEVPYACQVNVINYISRPSAKDFIQIEVLVEKNSQKIILIGKDGKALKILAIASRLDIEEFLMKKVYLEIEVKVKEKWRQDEVLLKKLWLWWSN